MPKQPPQQPPPPPPPPMHPPMHGYKVVGLVPIGSSALPPGGQSGTVIHTARIHVTNSDCLNNIVVQRMCLIRTSQISGNVSVVYDGPFLAIIGSWTLVQKSVMMPHASWGCPLWLVPGVQSVFQDHSLYYVEISWKWQTPSGKLPLIGFQLEDTQIYYANGEKYYSESQSQMEKMKI
ncbi:MAG: hypothetical protein MUO89_03420 [Dehalococcoidia bacterium]|nr:hypothetical protein [Dehalococcoidia bacterium]